MTTPMTSGNLIAKIQADVPDNNAGLVDPADVRNNMVSTVLSISPIVASGDTDGTYPFENNVRAEIQDPQGAPFGGIFIPESGILFPNAPVNDDVLQVQPYPGVEGIDHNQLANLDTGDPHADLYVSISGVANGRVMIDNLGIGNNFISASGRNNEGIKFVPTEEGQDLYVAQNVQFPDGSIIPDGNGVGRAWMNFDMNNGSDLPEVNSSYNIHSIERLDAGKVRITFASGIFKDNNYVAIGNSNARTSDSNAEDFDRHTVGLAFREGDDSNELRSITFAVLNEQGDYVDAEQNNFVAFGYNVGATPGQAPIVIG